MNRLKRVVARGALASGDFIVANNASVASWPWLVVRRVLKDRNAVEGVAYNGGKLVEFIDSGTEATDWSSFWKVYRFG